MEKPTCKIDGCERAGRARGWCNRHYEQWRKSGNPIAYVPTLQERMGLRTQKGEGCWIWSGTRDSYGYGRVAYQGKQFFAHRVAYELDSGPIPKGLRIDHICHTPLCVRPDHLRAVTIKENAENFSGLNSANVSGARGVYWDNQRGQWNVQVTHNRKRYSGGRHSLLAEAAEAARDLRNQLHTHNDLDRAEHKKAQFETFEMDETVTV